MIKRLAPTILVIVLLAFCFTGCTGGIPAGTYSAYAGDTEVSGYRVTVSTSLSGTSAVSVASPEGTLSYTLKSDKKLYKTDSSGKETEVGSVSYNKKTKSLTLSGVGNGYTYKKV